MSRSTSRVSTGGVRKGFPVIPIFGSTPNPALGAESPLTPGFERAKVPFNQGGAHMKRVLGLASAVLVLTFLAACDETRLRIDRVEPAEGITAGGDHVNIIGVGLQPGKTQVRVAFGGHVAEQVVISSNDKINVVTPTGTRVRWTWSWTSTMDSVSRSRAASATLSRSRTMTCASLLQQEQGSSEIATDGPVERAAGP